jgi:hypothetical protein
MMTSMSGSIYLPLKSNESSKSHKVFINSKQKHSQDSKGGNTTTKLKKLLLLKETGSCKNVLITLMDTALHHANKMVYTAEYVQ